MNFKDRKRYYNLCDPKEPLSPEDPRNVDFDALADEVRGASWAMSLAEQLELSDKPECLLVAGLPGSGKSTELKRLARYLSSNESAGLLPVFVDAEELLDLNSTIDIPDVVAAILFEAEKAVLEAEGKKPDEALQEGYLQRLWHWLTTTDAAIGKGSLSVPGAGSLTVELKTRPSLRQHVRTIVSSHLNQFLVAARKDLRALDLRATGCDYGGLLIIFDSLEKLRGTTSAWYDVLDSAEVFFRQSVPMLELPVHIIFTVPTALLTRIPDIELQPMLKLRTRAGEDFEPGIAAGRQLIAKRLPDEILAQVLGPDFEARCRQLVLWTGGYPRQLVQLLQGAIRGAAKGPLSEEAFQRLFAGLIETYQMLVPANVVAWLATVASERFMTWKSEEHRVAADRMLQNNVILYYKNGKGWHDLHPAVYENPAVHAALEALEASA